MAIISYGQLELFLTNKNQTVLKYFVIAVFNLPNVDVRSNNI